MKLLIGRLFPIKDFEKVKDMKGWSHTDDNSS